jgi:hypothetical protein
MGFQMSQPAEAEHVSASHCLDGAIQNMAAPPPVKANAHEMHKKAGSVSNTRVRFPRANSRRRADRTGH